MTATFGARAAGGGSADLSLGKRLRCRKARTISQITTASQIDDTKRSKVPPGRLQLGFAASIRGGSFGFRNGHSPFFRTQEHRVFSPVFSCAAHAGNENGANDNENDVEQKPNQYRNECDRNENQRPPEEFGGGQL